jgi:hypothetical protein
MAATALPLAACGSDDPPGARDTSLAETRVTTELQIYFHDHGHDVRPDVACYISKPGEKHNFTCSAFLPTDPATALRAVYRVTIPDRKNLTGRRTSGATDFPRVLREVDGATSSH